MTSLPLFPPFLSPPTRKPFSFLPWWCQGRFPPPLFLFDWDFLFPPPFFFPSRSSRLFSFSFHPPPYTLRSSPFFSAWDLLSWLTPSFVCCLSSSSFLSYFSLSFYFFSFLSCGTPEFFFFALLPATAKVFLSSFFPQVLSSPFPCVLWMGSVTDFFFFARKEKLMKNFFFPICVVRQFFLSFFLSAERRRFFFFLAYWCFVPDFFPTYVKVSDKAFFWTGNAYGKNHLPLLSSFPLLIFTDPFSSLSCV